MDSLRRAAESGGSGYITEITIHFSSGAPHWKEQNHWCHLNPVPPWICMGNYLSWYLLWWVHPEYILTSGFSKPCIIILTLKLIIYCISQMKNQKQELITSWQLTSNCFQRQDYNAGMLTLTLILVIIQLHSIYFHLSFLKTKPVFHKGSKNLRTKLESRHNEENNFWLRKRVLFHAH